MADLETTDQYVVGFRLGIISHEELESRCGN